MSNNAHQTFTAQASVSNGGAATITCPWDPDKLTVSASGAAYISFGTTPAASGFFISNDATSAVYFENVESTLLNVIGATSVLATVRVYAEKWDLKEVMSIDHPQLDPFGRENKTGGATRIGDAAVGDT